MALAMGTVWRHKVFCKCSYIPVKRGYDRHLRRHWTEWRWQRRLGMHGVVSTGDAMRCG